MKLATMATILVALIAGGVLISAPRSSREFSQLPQLVGATARLVAMAAAGNGGSLQVAAQDFAAALVSGRHTIVTRPALPGSQPRVNSHRLTWWR